MRVLSPASYTLITCHYGDPFWIRHTLSRVGIWGDHRIRRVIVVDQSRESGSQLLSIGNVNDVVEFPLDLEQVAILGHDHPASLDRAMSSISFDTSHVIVLDSDCFPIDSTWLDRVEGTTLAADPHKWGLTHPCFMSFPTSRIPYVNFSAGLLEVGIDTGRLVGLQLAQSGEQVKISAALEAFSGVRGHYYLDGSVYHHGSASFISSANVKLRSQVDLRTEQFFRSKIVRDDFKLSAFDRFRLAGNRFLPQLGN
jgi:hypothetical protein